MTRTPPPFPLERLEEISQRPEDFHLMERIPLTKDDQKWPVQLSEPVGDERPMVLLDTETTGLSLTEHSIIELGLAKVTYSPSAKRLVAIEDVVSLLEDPGEPIPENITELTGISNDMVRGHHIDEDLVTGWFADDPLVVAHHAQFDRPFFEARFESLGDLAWACSSYGIDWEARLDFKNRKLEFLLHRLGWFYQAHRAATDCLAVAWLLHQLPEALADLLSGAGRETVQVHALGSPYETKDALKERGYRWHNGQTGWDKHWWREVDAEALAEEKAFLDALYPHASTDAQYERKDARDRFKKPE